MRVVGADAEVTPTPACSAYFGQSECVTAFLIALRIADTDHQRSNR